VEGGGNARLSRAAERRENTWLGAALEGGYASGGGPDGCASLNNCTEEPRATAEGDACGGASTAADGDVAGGASAAGAGMVAWASSFVAAETASGLACRLDLRPPEYGSLCLRECLCLTAPMHHSMFPGMGTGECFCFEVFLTPMRSAVSGQVF
jgi:hypothetical protein